MGLLPCRTNPKCGLTEDEMRMYLEPLTDPATRKPLWIWPKELPIENDPPDVSKVIANYINQLRKSEVPKLLFDVQSGAIVPPETVEKCRAEFPNLEDVFLGASGHYIAEDLPHEIGEKVVSWSKAFI
jgi:haloalkane dehalogenase